MPQDFLVDCVTPKFNIFGAREDPFVSSFNIEGRTYLCLGQENSRAADQLQSVLPKLQDEETFSALIASLEADNDIGFEDGALEQLKEIRVAIKEATDLVSKEIHQNVAARNHRFIEHYHLEDLENADQSAAPR